MQRRTFLKVIAALTGAVATPAIATQLVEATEAISTPALGLIREIAAYDIARDELIVRYDIFCKEEQLQLFVDTRLFWKDKAGLEQNRQIAKELLENELKHRGLSWSDLTPLPIPQGYTPPDWLHA